MKESKLISNKTNGFDIFNFILLAVMALITLFPFYYMIITSFADYEVVRKTLIYLIPTSFNFSAYGFIFKTDWFLNAFFISVFITVVGTLFSLFASTAAAYTLSKKYIPGWKVIYTLALVPLFFSGGLIPYYLTVKNLGLINNILALILPTAMNAFYLILLKNFFEELPESIEESAKIDGANEIYILYKIVIPTSAPVIATISLFFAVDKWNEYYSALLFISDNKLYPLQLVLREVLLDFSMIKQTSIGAAMEQEHNAVFTQALQMAIVVIATIPILCVYPFLQKHFTKGILLGAVKE
jgi:ABC-type sugar transport system, permease component